MCPFLRAWLIAVRHSPLSSRPPLLFQMRALTSAPFSTSSCTIAQAAVLGGVHQRILIAFDRQVHIGAAIDQHLHLVEPAVLRGQDQRAAVTRDHAIGIGALIEQVLRDLAAARSRGADQRAAVAIDHRARVGAGRDHFLDALEIAVLRGLVERAIERARLALPWRAPTRLIFR